MEGELVDMLSTPLFVKVAREIADGVRLFDGAPPAVKQLSEIYSDAGSAPLVIGGD